MGKGYEATVSVSDDSVSERETWQGRFDFLVSCIGYCIGLGNVWRFPYLCYKNGGGAFLIPYVTTVVFAGIPMYFLELAIGQYYRRGALGVWTKIPAFKGVGYAVLVITGWICIYYTLVMAWSLWYLFHSFRFPLPWSTCQNDWNTEDCFSMFSERSEICVNMTLLNKSEVTQAGLRIKSVICDVGNYVTSENRSQTAVSSETEFWTRHTIRQSDSISDVGQIHWQMALVLLLVWVLCYFCIWKGVKWSGKVVYFTAMFPYVLMLVLLCRGATLPGALTGVQFYLYPQIDRLKDSTVWVEAATQVFYSTGIGYGAVIVFGSYNKPSYNMYRSAVLIATINSCTSFLVGFAVFSVLGFMADKAGKTVADVTASGPGLTFIVYPSALSELPGAPFWSCLFFLMLFMVGLDTQFCMMEGFFTSIIDEFPNVLNKRREIFIGVTCLLSYLVGLSMVTENGIYVFQLFDWYSGSRICFLFVVFFESVSIGWFYGGERFYEHIKAMIGYKPNPIFKYCWMGSVPLICSGLFLFSTVKYTPVSYEGESYPIWAEVIGWFFTLSSILCIPVVMITQVVKSNGSLSERLRRSFFPPRDEDFQPSEPFRVDSV